METLCFWISAIVLAIAVGITIFRSLRPSNRVRSFPTFYALTIGIFISITVMFLPLNYPIFKDFSIAPLATLASSLHTAIRFFIVDCDFDLVISNVGFMEPIIQKCYVSLACILFILAPLMTASVVLSFFENISAYNRFLFAFFRNTYVFSELNERSLSLAKSLKANDHKRLIIFTDVFDANDETSYELIANAKKLDAILFKNDIASINFSIHSKKTKLYFFIIGQDEVENINQTISLASPKETKRNRKKQLLQGTEKHNISYDIPRLDTRIYIFSTQGSTEQFLTALNPKYIKIRRINDVQSLIYRLLYEDGMQIFDSAIKTGDTVFNSATNEYVPEKKISAVVVGMGTSGTEMVRALSWFAQMHPYKLEINVFDKEEHIDSAFRSKYPDLFDINPAKEDLPEPKKEANGEYGVYKYHNGDYTTPGEAHYKISIHTGIDCELFDFDNKIVNLSDATFVFVALGDDDLNIRIATKIRILLRRNGLNPVIHTIVHNPNKQHMLLSGRTASGDSYDIRPYGDILSAYSEKCVLNSELEEKALERHLAYTYQVVNSKGLTGKERDEEIAAETETFWKYDYNYRSSIASVIHKKFKIECKIPGSDKAPNKRTEQENHFFRVLEHQRWNAYVRSDGFVFNEKRDKLAKTHHLLIPFEQLPYEEKIKDDN